MKRFWPWGDYCQLCEYIKTNEYTKIIYILNGYFYQPEIISQ